MPNFPVITVEHVFKRFKVPLDSKRSLRHFMNQWLRGERRYRNHEVLKDISFEVEKGDFYGIVGKNGSGKSTLLKIISDIYTCDSGKVTVNGILISFIELGVGFNLELTGRENVYLSGALLGFTNKEMDAMYDEIVDFAELHGFMDQRMEKYSSGMRVRLSFSVAIKAKGDILLLDEVLAVGDSAFQQKCHDYFVERKNNGLTTVLVTHDMKAVKTYCNKAILIENGVITVSGSPELVATHYRLANQIKKRTS